MKKTITTLLLVTASAIVVSAAKVKSKEENGVKNQVATEKRDNPKPKHGKVGNKKQNHGNYRDRYNERNPVKGGQLKQKGKKAETKPVPASVPQRAPLPKPIPAPIPKPPSPVPLPIPNDPGSRLPIPLPSPGPLPSPIPAR